ncbi:hypothetical protein F2Q69_00030871 [Brassica cretica]|uniref:Uncharacterized protein n=1 Tax=Brassica cretica TaxID=69181 RepID=A0A8S9S6U0_BRACR|nr:hypothetical protein F2Q69_00030871 [Brassica cretica]
MNSGVLRRRSHSRSKAQGGEKKTYTVLSQWLGALIVVDRSFMAVSIMEEESFY